MSREIVGSTDIKKDPHGNGELMNNKYNNI